MHQYLFMGTVSDFIPAGMYLNFLIQTEYSQERTENDLLKQALNIFEPEDEEEFWEKINSEAVQLCRDEMSLLQFWRKIAQKTEKDIPDEMLRDLWVKGG
ncbi:MAG: hypothetical protein HXS46_19635 [Theionarchaea archaeon]|nr:hypothetical protein [Theionarchaea archaeon]